MSVHPDHSGEIARKQLEKRLRQRDQVARDRAAQSVAESSEAPAYVNVWVCDACGRANDIDLGHGAGSNRCRFTGCPSHGDPTIEPLRSVRYAVDGDQLADALTAARDPRYSDAFVGNTLRSLLGVSR